MGIIEDLASNHAPAYWAVAGVVLFVVLFFIIYIDEELRQPLFSNQFITAQVRVLTKLVASLAMALYWQYMLFALGVLLVMRVLDRMMYQHGLARIKREGIFRYTKV